ncbi:EAL domain-containing protein [Lachnospiraceae bacterium YH-ros2226]
MTTYEFSPETRSFLENMPIPLAVYQYLNHKIQPLLVSKSYLELFGYHSCDEAVYGLNHDLYRHIHPEDLARMESASYHFATDGDSYDILFRNKRDDQTEYHLIHAKGKYTTVGKTKLAFITYSDETADKETNQKKEAVLTKLSGQYSSNDSSEYVRHFDSLTGLQNMQRFLTDSVAGIENLWEMGKVPVVLYFDLCGLKSYNSRHGLKAGDLQICELAKQIGRYFKREQASRFESDHFVVYSEADDIESRLQALYRDFQNAQQGGSLNIKTGIYRYEKDGTRFTEACDRARLASESIQQISHSSFVWFDQSLLKKSSLKSYIVTNFDKAVEEKWIQVWYQPVVRTMTKTVCSMEALVRWMDPSYGMISPGEFIPTLEETGKIYKLDLYVFEEVCAEISKRWKKGENLIPVSVNLSRKDFLHDDLPEAIDRISSKYEVPREFTCLEITESAFVKNLDKVDPFIRRFHEMGYKVWMDDFGSGYSSLGILNNYSFDELKLDMSFLRKFDDKSKRIITSFVKMAKELDISTLAEGVETKEQYLFLRKIGCEKIQGYYFGKPMEISSMFSHLQEKGLVLEPSKWRAYFTKLSRIDYLTDKTLCVVDDDGDEMKILFANDAYLEVLHRDHVLDVRDWEKKINTPGDPIHVFHRQYADQQLRRFSGPQVTAYPSGDHYMQLTGSVEAIEGRHELYTIHIQYIDINLESFQQVEIETMSDFYFMASDVAIYDLEKNTVLGVKSSMAEQPMSLGVELNDLASVMDAWRMDYCYLPDQDRMADFLDVSTLQARLKNNPKHALTGLFRSLTSSGEYHWFLHLIAPMQRSDFKRAVHVTLEVDLHESDIIKLASSLSDVIYGQKEEGITPEILWKNLEQGAGALFFWKDEKRRFAGVSQSFLRYFGFSTDRELIGKTDEDLRWHIDPKPFKKDEEEILKSGKRVFMKEGKCIINGTNRNILVNKIPIYRDGKIVGLMGIMFDAAMAQRFTDQQELSAAIDPITGLASARSLADGMISFLNEHWQSRVDFALLEINIPEYQEIQKLYGDESGNSLLRSVGERLKDCVGRGSVVGRTHDSLFYILMKYYQKEDVRNVARKIHFSIESLRKAGQWSGNCTAIIKASYSVPEATNRSSYLDDLSFIYMNSKDQEEL